MIQYDPILPWLIDTIMYSRNMIQFSYEVSPRTAMICHWP